MHSASRRPQLPALSYLDIDNANSNAHPDPDSPTAPAANGAVRPPQASVSSPTSAQSQTSLPPLPAAPETHRVSADEYREPGLKARQSLPSISEALGVDSHSSYTSAPSSRTHAPALSSPVPGLRRPYLTENALESPAGYSSYPSYPSFRQDSAGPATHPSVEQSKSVPRPERSDRYSTAAPYEPSSSASTRSMAPPGFPYGYTSHGSRYAEPSQPTSEAGGPIYRCGSQYTASQPSVSPWSSDSPSSRGRLDEHSSTSTPYGESVKRHLDLYDLEAALNEIAQTSGIVLDFSRRYSDRMHSTARSTPSLGMLPSMIEIDDMLHKSRLQLDSLNKIREVILTERAAYEQQLADQRQHAKSLREAVPPPPPPPVLGEILSDSEGKGGPGGFVGGELKKRRGRAAPPGRCHSCNRAETPEWRRGPDGARTLCNACGLHYAKLTRKQTNANKAAAVAAAAAAGSTGTSNLRPKEV